MTSLRTPSALQAFGFVLGLAGLYLIGGIPLQLLLGEAGIVAIQLGLLLLPALWFVRALGVDPVETFSLRPLPGGGAIGAAGSLMAGGILLAWFLAWVQGFFLPIPVEMLERMAEFLTTDDPIRFLWLLFLVAVLPAVAEEFVFRGVVLSGLRSRFGPALSVFGSAALFGGFHLSPETAFRFLPTFWLGLLLGWVVVETRSIWMGVGLHFLNNALILLISFLPATREIGREIEVNPPLALLPVGVALFVLGAIRLRRVSPFRLGQGSHP
jgi:sodium transport system permease protein